MLFSWFGRSVTPVAGRSSIAAFALVGAFSTGCRSRDAASVKFVALVSDVRPGKSLGIVNALDCATQVFGIGRDPKSLSVNGALERSQREQGTRYLNNMSIDMETKEIVAWKRTCIVVKGEGFR